MRIILITYCVLLTSSLIAQFTQVNDWHYIQIDDDKQKWGDWRQPEWLRYFGLDMMDVNGDDYLDVISGRYIYHNPGGNMDAKWERYELPDNVDGILAMDIDGDENADIIAQALPNIYWFEATDATGKYWMGRIIGAVPATSHVNSQGFERAQIVPGGKEEFVIAGDGDIYLFEIPERPDRMRWKSTLVAQNTSDEGIGIGDIDGDGDMDIAAGRRPEGADEPLEVVWFQNPGMIRSNWLAFPVGKSVHPTDRVEVADLNGDDKTDIIISEERYPGLEPDANLYWFEQKSVDSWERKTIVTQYSMNNLDVKDLDRDGDLDLVTNEHKGKVFETQIWENDGYGNFKKSIIDTGKENHLGTQLADMDCDGDFDLIGAAWDEYEFMHLWRNDYYDNRFEWKHLSTADYTLPRTNGSNEQTASLVTDLNQDGINDIIITDRTVAPSVIAMIYTPEGWERYVIDDTELRIEAGSAAYDIDGDGDMDIVFGGESQSNEIWWWENPYPNSSPEIAWQRYTIKKSGATKHHDQAFIDFDGDGQKELVFWNQGAHGLYYANIPDDPKSVEEWMMQPIYQYDPNSEIPPRSQYPSWRSINEHEGLFAMDMNADGVNDIVGGGRWFEYQNGSFKVHEIDPSYTFTRAVAGDLIKGNRPEVVMVVGDGIGDLILYEWKNGKWQDRILIEDVYNGHTLDIVDFNGDGHLDIFNAEMRFGTENLLSEIRILLGDGKGNFRKHVVAKGYGVHEGKLVDLNGDGKLDVLGKPYNWQAPRLDIWLNVGEKTRVK
ncbi:MAG: VCBS repeat-containing protein [Bacteroidota bacterium]